MEFVNWWMPPAESQLALLETALRVLSGGALATVCAASLTYCLLWLAEFRRAPRRLSAAPAPRPRRASRRAPRPF